MGVRLKLCISHKLQGDTNTGPWTHFIHQGCKGLVKFQSICALLSPLPFTVFFFFFISKSTASHSSLTLFSASASTRNVWLYHLKCYLDTSSRFTLW